MGIIFRWKRCFQGQRRCPVGVFCQFKCWVLNLFLEGKHSSWETGESRIFPDILLQRQSLDSRGDNPRARCLPPLLHAPSDSWARVRLSRRSSGHSPSTAPEIRQLVETWIGTWQLFEISPASTLDFSICVGFIVESWPTASIHGFHIHVHSK